LAPYEPFAAPPLSLEYIRDRKAVPASPTPHWIEDAIAFRSTAPNAIASFRWPEDPETELRSVIYLNSNDIILCHGPDDLLPVLCRPAFLATLDIDVMQISTLTTMSHGRPVTTSFSRGHNKHAWAVAFKGRGHDRLPSRRWLTHGPWHLLRLDDAQDITFLQFHDLDAAPDVAWWQAFRAHQRIGISDHGGYMIPPEVGGVTPPFTGVYKAADRLLTVVKADTAPQQADLLDLCRLRRTYRHDPAKPIARLRVLFTDERDARRHLHELWLRELECWYFDAAGRERRLDDTYQPTRIVPEWVERVEQLPPAGVLLRVVAPAPPAEPVTSYATPGPFPFEPPTPSPDFTATARFALGTAALGVTDPRPALDGVLRFRRQPPAHHDYTLRDGDVAATLPGKAGPDTLLKYRTPRADFLAAVRATAHTVDVALPLERLGVGLPALLVPGPYPEQLPLRPGDSSDLPAGHPLHGVTILPVDDVLHRVAGLDRLDLLPLEALLLLCYEQGDVVAVTAPR
jgi:hypothetical protein